MKDGRMPPEASSIEFAKVKGSQTESCDRMANPRRDGHKRRKSIDILLVREVLPTQMATKIKGLLKGLRHLTQIFEPAKEQEMEMQIGHPTNVKHVGHIGWDGGPSQTPPTWMNDYQAALETLVPENSSSEVTELKSSRCKRTHGSSHSSGRESEFPMPPRDSDARDTSNKEQPNAPKALRRRCYSANGSPKLYKGDTPDIPKQPRRHHWKSWAVLGSSMKELAGAAEKMCKKKRFKVSANASAEPLKCRASDTSDCSNHD